MHGWFWVGTHRPTELCSYQTKLHQIFCSTWKRRLSIKFVLCCWYLDPFKSNMRSNSKGVQNCEKLWMFFVLPNFREWSLAKVVHTFLTPFCGTSCGKVSWGYAPFPQSYCSPYAEFQSNFAPPFEKKIVGGPPSRVRCTLIRLGHSLMHVKISGCSAP